MNKKMNASLLILNKETEEENTHYTENTIT